MKLTGSYIEKVGEDGEIELREPTPEEWNQFVADRYPVTRKGKMIDKSGEARCALFDKIAVRVTNLEDNEGPITMTDLQRIPARIKGKAILNQLEKDTGGDDEKN